SIWLEYKENPLGWTDAGKVGTKAECLAYINEVWTDMRPLSLRKQMEETARNPPPPLPPPDLDRPREETLVERLTKGRHPIEAGLRPERTAERLKAAIDRNYMHIKFTRTKGGTELGVSLDGDACDFSSADFESGVGKVHLEGGLTIDYV